MIFIRSRQKRMLMRYSRISEVLVFILLLIWPCIAFCAGADDYPMWREDGQIGEPIFRLFEFQRFSTEPGRIRLEIYAPIKYDMLQFIRQDSTFTASVEMNLSISGDDRELLERKIKYFSAETPEYATTNSRSDFLIGTFVLNLAPGNYAFTMLTKDQESKRISRIEKEIELKFPQIDQCGVSGLMLTTSMQVDQDLNTPVHPVVNPKEIDCKSDVFCYFEIFRADPQKEMHIELSVLNSNDELQSRDTLRTIGGEELSSYFLPLNCNDLTFGRYTIRLIVRYEEVQREIKYEFTRNSSGLPGSINDIDNAIKRLSLIASSAEMNELLSFPKSDREQKLVDFWNEIFPTPDEETNGKMTEYYRRIGYVNKQYGDGHEGWRTDRGRVYIIYGKPTDIEKHVFVDQQAPTENWYYSHLGKQFVFRDENGFGTYRLVSPFW